MPSDTPDYMAGAWVSALLWATQSKDCMGAFQASTGCKPPTSPTERMIDSATGNDKRTADAFVVWFNKNVWGPMDGPEADANAGEVKQ
jgi:hypothetical protein